MKVTRVTKIHDPMNWNNTERRTIVPELIVVGFKKDMYRASEVLNELSRLNYDWVVDLHDAVAVYRDYGGKLRVDQSYQMTTGEGAGWGALWGLMIGSILAIPFTAGASAAAAGAAGRLPAGGRRGRGQHRSGRGRRSGGGRERGPARHSVPAGSGGGHRAGASRRAGNPGPYCDDARLHGPAGPRDS